MKFDRFEMINWAILRKIPYQQTMIYIKIIMLFLYAIQYNDEYCLRYISNHCLQMVDRN